jgi:(p)ppGpp synthase/HD superfamily hydrolase
MRSAPGWIGGSALLARAYSVAAEAHAGQKRATDGTPFIGHVVEVGGLLEAAGLDEDLVAAGLLHDSVERGTLSSERLRQEVADEIWSLVMALTEDPAIVSFEQRKAALREQVREAGGRAITIFAADKLSDIRGLRRGIARSRGGIEARIGTTVSAMAAHYGKSVAMIEENEPDSEFLAALRAELEGLATMAVPVGRMSG